MRHRLAEARNGTERDTGFTLIELLVVIGVLPILLGGIAVALLSVLSLQTNVSNRIGDSNDALVASTNFNRDVQSAELMTTQSTPAACGATSSTSTQILGLEWGANSLPSTSGGPTGGYDTVVSYMSTQVTNPNNGTKTYTLTRQLCTFGTSSTPKSTFTVAHDIGSPTVTVYGAKLNGQFQTVTANFSSGWYSSQGVTSVTFGVNAPGSGFNYTLVGLPGQSMSTGAASTLTTVPAGTPECGFAALGTGTYSAQLCFADFTNYNAPLQSSGKCQTMQIPVADTPYTLSACVSYSGTPVVPNIIPTYYNPSGYNSEAFLGNNGFYTNIPGDAALYQSNGNSPLTTVYFTNIQLLDAAGHAASGWTLVTGDAESTDANEWMVFQSNLNWSVLDNSPGNPFGNDCFDSNDPGNQGFMTYVGPTPPTAANTIQSGGQQGSLNSNVKGTTASIPNTGTSSVLCEASIQLNKTGTIMVEAQEPTGSSAPQTLTVTMRGAGLEALFLGVYL
jgi:prepilin-type N-terminal cleavage/methylation domain-containing protein